MRKITTFLFLCLFTCALYGQVGAPDCIDAVAVCETSIQNFQVSGIGNVDELPNNPSGCLGSGGGGTPSVESNSIWFRFRADRNGQLGFNIIPDNPTDDWDFALYGPNLPCSAFGDPNNIIQPINGICNYNGGNPNDGGQTGVGTPPSGASAGWYSPFIDILEGEEYLLLINSFQGGNDAFTLEWTGDLVTDGGGNPLDCSIVVGELGADQDVCEGETVTLDATPSTGMATSYTWFLDDGSGFSPIVGQTGATIEIGGPDVPAISGIYRVIVTDMDGNDGDDEVNITFHPQPTIGTLGFTTYEQCDTDDMEDGLFTFDLVDLFGATLLDGQDPTIFELRFYRTPADADADTNPIGDPTNFTNPVAFTAEEIYARVLNTAAPNACTPATARIELLVLPEPNINNTSDYELCDDDTDGDDTNGIVQSFILSTKDGDILGGQDPTQFTVSYYLDPTDAQAGTNALDKINPIANTTTPQEIFVRVENNTTGCFSFTPAVHFSLIVNLLPVVTDVVLLSACDDDQNGFFTFDLTDANPNISADFATLNFRYYPTELDAQNATNEILSPTNYDNPTETNASVWVRTITVNGCLRISRIDLRVTNTVIRPSFERSFEECDDFLDQDGNNTAGNDDTDGITTFNFGSVTQDIVDEFPASQTYNLTYYESMDDANNAVNAIPDISNHRNINSPFTQQIYIRVENPADNTCLYVGTHVTLTVNPVPDANPVTDLDICDDDDDGDDLNGFIQSINLESQTSDILNGQDPSIFSVTYHESASDATSGINAITSPFSNTVANNQTIYVRVTNTITQCYTDRSSFEVNIRPLPVITDTVQLRQCDDDTDGRAPFNLNEANILISSNSANETFEFFTILADAQNGTNVIPNPTAYINPVPTNDVVWARAISSFDCFRIAEVNLVVATSSATVLNFPPSTYNTCDDFLDQDGNDTANNNDTDGISEFDFSDFTTPLIEAFPVNERPNLIVAYYRNQADALAELNAITDISTYRNIGYPNTQQIYVRVDNITNNECIGVIPLITLIVDPVPVSNMVPDLEACDNADDRNFSNGFIQTFNIESQTAGILGGQDPTIYNVTYHLTALDASQGTNAITNTTAYTNTTPNRQTIYVRVEHSIQGCYVDRNSFDLVVNPLPEANFVPDIEVCDDGTGGSAQNGFTSNIDLELQTPGILGTQDPTQFTVSYYRSLADAQANNNPIVGIYANETAFVQTIYVRVLNTVTDCANDISNFNVIINLEPTVVDIGDLPYCDDNLDGDDTNGFVQNIDLDSQIPLLLGPDQDEDDFTVTFHESLGDAASGASPLSSPYANTMADTQPIFVRIVNDDTQCVNSSFSFDVIINPLPDFQVTTPQIVCLNGPVLTLAVENPAGIYDYVWTSPDGTETIGSQIDVTSGGIYSVTGTATDGTDCARTREIEVNESIIATLTDEDVIITDDSDNNSITINPENLGIGDYEYALADENGIILFSYQDDPLFENLAGGFYRILVRDKNGCGIATLDVPVVEFPKFFTPNNDGINDTWAIKGVNSLFFPESEVNIFNRFGKVVAQINVDNPGWDGTFNGKTLPSDDYWYAIKLTDRNGISRERRGNLSLLRR